MPFLTQVGQTLFFYQGFLSWPWRFTGQQVKGGDHRLFHSATSIRSRTFRHLFATLHVSWLSHIFSRNACVYQTVTRCDLQPYRITIRLIDWWCRVCLFNWWVDSKFCYSNFDIGNWWTFTSTFTLVLQANRLTKCVSVALTWFKFGISSYNCHKFPLRWFYNHSFLL